MTDESSGFNPNDGPLPTAVQPAPVRAHLLKDDGQYPNNPLLPLLIYPGAFDFPEGSDAAAVVEAVFKGNRWRHSWRNGVFGFHHYHSTAHEALGVYSGRARLQLGGQSGLVVEVERGDVLVLAAGTAHKNLKSSTDFRVVGAYPSHQDFDMNYGHTGERPHTDENIRRVPLPQADPIYGPEGPLLTHWRGIVRDHP